MNRLLLDLKQSGVLTPSLYFRLRSSAGKIPLLYGLPKIHKPEIPLRPIVSFVGSPSYQLSKHLTYIISPLVGKTSSHVKNSTHFAEFISMQSVYPGEVLVSFDVVSLFTNIPVNLACRIAEERLNADDTLGDRTGLSPEQVLSLLRLCLNATFLAYQGEYYQQIFGTAMGSPVSATIADLVMEDVEKRALSSFPNPPPFWKRYVDDTCTTLHPDSIPVFHQHLNSIEPSIQFTYEVEQDGVIPFLDTEVTHHSDGSLSTKVYRKKTHTDQYLNFQSHHPLSHKLAVPRTLFSRAQKLCTYFPDRITEDEHVEAALRKNGYPRTMFRNPPPQSFLTSRTDNRQKPQLSFLTSTESLNPSEESSLL